MNFDLDYLWVIKDIVTLYLGCLALKTERPTDL
jgi:hypothetical protein